MTIREPAVQGRFYSDTRSGIMHLFKRIEAEKRYPVPDMNIQSALGGVLPHAGHVYSGYQTFPLFQLMVSKNLYPELFVIIHPNHSGYGDPVALDESSAWQNVLGTLEIDKEFMSFLDIPGNKRAHAHEHSGEVIMPFIQYFFDEHEIKILPICMLDQSYHIAKSVGEKLFNATRMIERDIFVIASSDFSHYVSPEEGAGADQLVINAIQEKNIEGVYNTVRSHHISVCGYGPIMALMTYAELVDKQYKQQILARGHSGEVYASPEVVDYISMIFYK